MSANVLSSHRQRRAKAEFAEFGDQDAVRRILAREAQGSAAIVSSDRVKASAGGTHGIGYHCPGSIAFGLLGGAVVKPLRGLD